MKVTSNRRQAGSGWTVLYSPGSCLHSWTTACCCAGETHGSRRRRRRRRRGRSESWISSQRESDAFSITTFIHIVPTWHLRSVRLVQSPGGETAARSHAALLLLCYTGVCVYVCVCACACVESSSPITRWWYPSIPLCDLEAACAPPARLARSVPHCKKCGFECTTL